MAAVRDRIESLSFQEILKAKDSKLKLKYLAPQHRLTTTTDTTTDIHYTHYTIHYTHHTSNYAQLHSITLNYTQLHSITLNYARYMHTHPTPSKTRLTHSRM